MRFGERLLRKLEMSSVLISSYLERKSFHSTTAVAVDSKRNTADNTARIAAAASH